MQRRLMQHFTSIILLSVIFNVNAQVKINTWKLTYDKQPCTKDCGIEYPIIIYKDTTISNKINLRIASCFGDEDSTGNSLKSIFDLNNLGNWTGTTELHYSIKTNTSRLLSLSFDSEYTGAYPTEISSHKNFDLTNGNEIDIIQLFNIRYYIELAKRLQAVKQKAVIKNRIEVNKYSDADKESLESLKENDKEWIANSEPDDFYILKNILYLTDDAKNAYPHIMGPIMPYINAQKIEPTSFNKFLTSYGKYIFGLSNEKSVALVKNQFRGSIANYNIKLVFTAKPGLPKQEIEGYYFYTNKGILLYAKGFVDDTKIHLDIYDVNNIIIEQFDGTCILENNNLYTQYTRKSKTITGKWKNLKNQQELPFKLQESDF